MKEKRNRKKPVRDMFGRMPVRYCMGGSLNGMDYPNSIYAGYRDFRRGHAPSTF